MSENNDYVDYWNVWGLDVDEFNDIINANENAYSGICGYVAEVRAREQFFDTNEYISNLSSPRDHDRSEKGDIVFDYKGEEIRIEVKSLNTQDGDITIEQDIDGDNVYKGTAQVMASDNREITLRNGKTRTTSLLEVGEFDVLAVNMFEYFEGWQFMFIKNEDLPRSSSSERLLKSNPDATYPPDRSELPYSEDPFELIEETISSRDETDEVELNIQDPDDEDTSLSDFTS